MQFQIRDDQFGLALYEAETATEALADFLADRLRGRLRETILEAPDGERADVEIDGEHFHALRAD